jgi:hypothetical protein
MAFFPRGFQQGFGEYPDGRSLSRSVTTRRFLPGKISRPGRAGLPPDDPARKGKVFPSPGFAGERPFPSKVGTTHSRGILGFAAASLCPGKGKNLEAPKSVQGKTSPLHFTPVGKKYMGLIQTNLLILSPSYSPLQGERLGRGRNAGQEKIGLVFPLDIRTFLA